MLEWNGRVVLVDTGPDLRAQCLREGVKHVDAVIYTHTHADHVHGIDDLRPFNAGGGADIDIYGSWDTVRRLERTFAYAFKPAHGQGFCPRLEPHVVEGAFELFGLRIVPVELEHGRGSVLGYRFGSLAYLTDCSRIPAAAADPGATAVGNLPFTGALLLQQRLTLPAVQTCGTNELGNQAVTEDGHFLFLLFCHAVSF
jgi:phosphoribosyl 1,2-cyclic phosphate phosphodiesterase